MPLCILLINVSLEKNVSPKSHEDRKRYFNIVELKQIRSFYLVFEWESRRSRYDCVIISKITADESISNLKEIENRILI